MSRLVTILGVIAAVAAAVFGLVSALSPQAAIYVMLVGTAAAAAGKELLDPKALRRGLPRRGAFARRRKLKVMVGALGLSAALLVSACSPPQLGAVARGIEVGAQEFAREVEAMRRDGDLTDQEARAVAPIFQEIASSARVLGLSAADFKSLTPAGKRELIMRFVSEMEQSAGRLEARGLVFKSEKARASLKRWRGRVRQGVAALRVIEATIPQQPGG